MPDRTRFFFLASFHVLLLISLACCGRASDYGGLEYGTLTFQDSMHLFRSPAYPSCGMILSLELPTSSSVPGLAEKVDSVILSGIFPGLSASILNDSQKAFREAFRNYSEDYCMELEDLVLEEQKEHGTLDETVAEWMEYRKTVTSRILAQDGMRLTIELMSDEFRGGIHDDVRTDILNLDLGSLRVLNLDDVFQGDYWETLREALQDGIMKDFRVKSLQELENLDVGTLGPIEPSDNFILEKDAITFVFNPYEIAPYHLGRIDVRVPLDGLEDILRKP